MDVMCCEEVDLVLLLDFEEFFEVEFMLLFDYDFVFVVLVVYFLVVKLVIELQDFVGQILLIYLVDCICLDVFKMVLDFYNIELVGICQVELMVIILMLVVLNWGILVLLDWVVCQVWYFEDVVVCFVMCEGIMWWMYVVMCMGEKILLYFVYFICFVW